MSDENQNQNPEGTQSEGGTPETPETPKAKAEVAPKRRQTKAQQVKASFADQGIPVSQWADENGYRRSDVYRVLNGFTACKRGLPHEIAVKLGLKPAPAKAKA